MQLSDDEVAGLEAKARADLGSGRFAEAAARFSALLDARPQVGTYAIDLASARLSIGPSSDALSACKQAVERNRGSHEAFYLLGACLQRSGRFAEAAMAFRQAIVLQPSFALAYNSLGNCLYEVADFTAAEEALRGATALEPQSAMMWLNLGRALHGAEKVGEAIDCFERAIALEPQWSPPHNNLATALRECAQLWAAGEHAELAIEFDPKSADALSTLGLLHRDLGDPQRAADRFRASLAIEPRAQIHSNYLFSLLYHPEISAKQILDEHRRFDELYAQPLTRFAERKWDRTADRPLRLGFVSADLGRHPVGFFLSGVLSALDRKHFSAFCYSDRKHADDLTERLRSRSDQWIESAKLSDDALGANIQKDGIDILFDLSGHTGKNRLLLFARKPAPLQISWLGYAFSTGLSAIDAVLSDGNETPIGCEHEFVESVIRLPHGYLCYEPPATMPEIAPLPALSKGHLTFGCFNNLSKLNAQVLDLWAAILCASPSSTLLLKTPELNQDEVRDFLLDEFARRAVAPAMLDLRPGSPHRELLTTYNEVDVALDPFPYGGGLTTCEALLMGVPVLTLGGDRFCSRHSISHLQNIGLPEFVVDSKAAYQARALALGNDIAALSRLRSTLRQCMLASPLCDAPRFARDLEAALRTLWRQRCEKVE